MIDSHCHIGLDGGDINAILTRAENSGISEMLVVACSMTDYRTLLTLLDQYPCLYGAFGIHPETPNDCPSKTEFADLFSNHSKMVAVGECGLDYHYYADTKAEQRHAFEYQIERAHALQKPLIIHTREADSDTISILDAADKAHLLDYGGVLHCFTGTQELADKALDVGFYISASGVITFKSTDSVRDVFATIPMDRLLIETDSPYMAPVPYRGKENEPSFMIKTAEKLAGIKGVSLSEIDKQTTENFYRLFVKGVK